MKRAYTVHFPRLILIADFAQASCPIRYRYSDEPQDTVHQTVFQVADARHDRAKARKLVREWLEGDAG